MTWILVLTIGSQFMRGVGVTAVSLPYSDIAACHSAGERWKLEAKDSTNTPQYYCIPAPDRPK